MSPPLPHHPPSPEDWIFELNEIWGELKFLKIKGGGRAGKRIFWNFHWQENCWIWNFKQKTNFQNEFKNVFMSYIIDYLKLVSDIVYQIFISHQLIALKKLWKMFFISSKKLYLFSRYSNFCFSFFRSFSPCQPLLQRLIEEKS